MSDTATVTRIVKTAGIAGQYGLTATVAYEGEEPSEVTFVGSTYGGPVVMLTGFGNQTFVTDPERFGPFGTEWVKRFFASR